MSLFKSTAEIKKYVPRLSRNMSFETLLTDIQFAELEYIIPFVGQPLFDELDEAYNSDEGPNDKQSKLIIAIQRGLAFYTTYEATRERTTPLTDAGALENTPDNSTLARQWVYNQALESALTKADRMFDKALEHLEKNEEDFETWVASEEYSISKELFINKTTEFSKHVPIDGSRRAFLKIRPYIALTEKKILIPAIGKPLFDKLKEGLIDNNLEGDYLDLYEMIQCPLAHLSFVEALPNLMLEVKGSGIRIVSTADGYTQSKEANDKQIKALGESNLNNGETFLASVKKYLEENPDKFPEYANSASYKNGQPKTTIHDNTGRKSFFV